MAANAKAARGKTKRRAAPQSRPAVRTQPGSLDDLVAAINAVHLGTGPQPDAAGKPGRAEPAQKHGLWETHRLGRVAAPFGWIAAADSAAMCFRCAVDFAGAGGQAAAAGGFAVIVFAAWRTVRGLRRRREPRSRELPPLTGAQRRMRRRAAAAWAAAICWSPLVIFVTPAGPYGIVQDIALAGGVGLAAGHLFAHRRQDPVLRRAITAGTDGGAPEDERLVLLRRRLVTGTTEGSKARLPWRGCEISGFAEVDGGFAFEVTADPETDTTYDAIAQQATTVASLFDVPRGQVLVDEGRSARRALFTVLTMTGLFSDPYRWDGKSTYDPATGAVRIGRFGDETPARWRIHAPRSGMWGGGIYGAQGTGKSGDMHKIAAEAGIVLQCAHCGTHRGAEPGTALQCPDCDGAMSRKFLLFMGDPQKQPFSVWKGRADLTFWGPAACVFMQQVLREIMDERSAAKGTETWTDAKGREREGRGWFDPSPVQPGLVSITDELPDVVSGPGGLQAVADMEKLNAKGRKAGIGEIIAAQMPDAPWTGDSRANRELLKGFTTIAHRVDGQSKGMLGIKGNAVDLPSGPGMHGVGYIGGIDDRSAAPYRTDEFPEDAADGVDAMDMADLIASLPVTFDPAVQKVLDRYGLIRGDIVDDEWMEALGSRPSGREPAPQADPAVTAPAPAGPVSTGAVTAVRAALSDHAAETGLPAELYDLMKATGLPLGATEKALAVLRSSGHAAEVEPRQWCPGRDHGYEQSAAGAL